jgi:hypothetical protein
MSKARRSGRQPSRWARGCARLWCALSDEEREKLAEAPADPRPWQWAVHRLDAAFGGRGEWMAASLEAITMRLAAHAGANAGRGGEAADGETIAHEAEGSRVLRRLGGMRARTMRGDFLQSGV